MADIIQHNKPAKGDRVPTFGPYSFFDADGALHVNVYAEPIMVRDENDLDEIPEDKLIPGTLAYTAGFANLWHLGANGEWEEM